MARKNKQRLTDDEFRNVHAKLFAEPDTSVLIVGAAIAHSQLQELVGGALGPFVRWNSKAADRTAELTESFSQSIDLAHRLRLIPDDLFRALHRLREMRNRVAHGWSPQIELTKSPFREHLGELESLLHPQNLEALEWFAQLDDADQPPSFARLRHSKEARILRCAVVECTVRLYRIALAKPSLKVEFAARHHISPRDIA